MQLIQFVSVFVESCPKSPHIYLGKSFFHLTRVRVRSIFSSNSRSQNSQTIPLRQTKVFFLSRHTLDSMVQYSGSVVPPGLFANTAWRFILLCEILSPPPPPRLPCLNPFHSPSIRSIQKGQCQSRISTHKRTSTHFCVAFAFFAAEELGRGKKIFYDRCQRQSFSRSTNNISAVTIPSHIKCIELPALSRFPPLATSQSGWGMGVEGVVADERWQESGHSGWLSEDVMRARIPRWRIARGEDGDRGKEAERN